MKEKKPPAPDVIFENFSAFQRTEALKAAVSLDLFTAIGKGFRSVEDLANACQASTRGVRILCDFLVIQGLIWKRGGCYELTPESAAFLDRRSDSYMGRAVQFLTAPFLVQGFRELEGAVREGGTVIPEEGTLAPDHDLWVEFARSMAPVQARLAHLVAEIAGKRKRDFRKILDLAAGHGMFGIALAGRNPEAHVYAVDWPNVLEVAEENARKASLLDRYHLMPGSAFEVDYGTQYDVVLLANFLHHFDPATCEALLRKVHGALGEEGVALTLEFVPNEDRISPPRAAAFSLTMLATTPAGDAYTFSEYEQMFRNAGFSGSQLDSLEVGPQNLIVSFK